MSRANQRGENKIGCVISLAVLIFVFFAATKVTPVMINMGDFNNTCERIAERASFPEYRTEEKMHHAILTEAENLNLPLTAENLEIVRTRKRVKIKAEYHIEIDLIVYTYRIDKVHKVEREIF